MRSVTEPRDARSLDHETLEEMRRLAISRILAGETQREVARSLQVHSQTVWKWVQWYRSEGEGGLASTTATGRPPSLTARQQEQLRRTIIGKRPEQLTLGGALWTIPLVGDLVAKKFGVVLHGTTVARILHRLGLTPQKPKRRAFQRDEDEVRRWMTTDFPNIVRSSKRRQSVLVFVDEAAIQENGPVGTTWGTQGETPVVPVSESRRRINLISGVTPRGQLWFGCYGGTLDAELFVEYLRDLRRTIRKPLDVILDRHPAHVAASTRRWVQDPARKMRLHFLPAYSPDLNPDEHVWSYLKGMFRREPVREKEVLLEAVENTMFNIQDDRKLVRSFFQHPEVAYIRKALGWK